MNDLYRLLVALPRLSDYHSPEKDLNMNRSLRFCASCALLALVAACAANPQYVPERRAPTPEEVARHNAAVPQNLQLVCRSLYNTGSYIKRRVCWLRQDMHLRQNERDRIWVANAPADSIIPEAYEDLFDRIPLPAGISDL